MQWIGEPQTEKIDKPLPWFMQSSSRELEVCQAPKKCENGRVVNTMLASLPALTQPWDYEGLYVYDFGEHVAVGYTAAEVRVLRESVRFQHGTAYEIYRVTPEGALELRGVSDARLAGTEATGFFRSDLGSARRDFDQLRALAGQSPIPVAAELRLVRCYAWEPPNATLLEYPRSASTLISAWLCGTGFAGGDEVRIGGNWWNQLHEQSWVRVADCRLPGRMNHRDRTPQEVLQSVDQSVQR